MRSPSKSSRPDPGRCPQAGRIGVEPFSAQAAGRALRAAGLVREEVTVYVAGQPFRIARKVSTIGRSRDCDVVVPDPNVKLSPTNSSLRCPALECTRDAMGSTTNYNGIHIDAAVTISDFTSFCHSRTSRMGEFSRCCRR